MKQNCGYLMKSEDEALRLEIRTNARLVDHQALWPVLNPASGLRSWVGVAGPCFK